MFIAQLGRQPELSLAELAAVFGDAQVTQIASDFALVRTDTFDIDRLGGTIKCAQVVHEFPSHRDDNASFLAASKYITEHYGQAWRSVDGKITLGLSAYHFNISPRVVQKTGLLLKSSLKKAGVSLRLIPNDTTALSTATSHNNKLGLSERKVELLILKTADRRVLIAQSHGAQNITAYTLRDRHRPKRDAFVGMLPPKLAQIMINLAIGPFLAPLPSSQDSLSLSSNRATKLPETSAARVSAVAYATETRSEAVKPPKYILDPFCGTGTVLQEAILQGHFVLGSDLSDKMVDYSNQNLTWLTSRFNLHHTSFTVTQGDAMTHHWSQPIDAVVCETYLGQPFSAPPSPAKLKEVVGNCNHIISSFLKNIHPQLKPGTPLCIAVPAWQSKDGTFTHLPLIRSLKSLGYTKTVTTPLLYHRPDQVVARELLVLKTMN